MSPANGEDDFEIASKHNVPIFVPIDDRVIFTEKAGAFKDLFVRDADMKVIEAMKEARSLPAALQIPRRIHVLERLRTTRSSAVTLVMPPPLKVGSARERPAREVR